MVARVSTVAFQGLEVLDVDVEVHMADAQMPAFAIVGLGDKAIAESKERVRAALGSMGLSMPAKRITVNLAPADIAKEGSHYDLPIALGLLAFMNVIPAEELYENIVLGELALDGSLRASAGVLPSAVHARSLGKGLICPYDNGAEAAWADPQMPILAPKNLLALMNHFKGTQVLTRPQVLGLADDLSNIPDFSDIRGQEGARRALEVAAAGGHNLLMVGPPGAGKSMLASRFPSILPDLSPDEALEVSMIQSIAGKLENGQISRRRPYRDPHHSASLPALVGGGVKAKPGEISLAHRGVLFLDELPEFARGTLESLRQPLEAGRVMVARANHHLTYPSRFQFVAAMNPCPCGNPDEQKKPCSKGVNCIEKYQGRISEPLYDRIDIHIDVPAVKPVELIATKGGEASAGIKKRVLAARKIQLERLAEFSKPDAPLRTNSDLQGDLIEKFCHLEGKSKDMLLKAAEDFRLSARAYFRTLKVARTLADMDGAANIDLPHVAEALQYRRKI